MSENIKLKIWGRELNLKIEYDCYKGEEVLQEQKEALNNLTQNLKPVEDSKEAIIKYCLERDGDKVKEIENIFKYVMPRSLFVKRKGGKVYLVCQYRFNEDDGIAAEFIGGKFSKVGSGNII